MNIDCAELRLPRSADAGGIVAGSKVACIINNSMSVLTESVIVQLLEIHICQSNYVILVDYPKS